MINTLILILSLTQGQIKKFYRAEEIFKRGRYQEAIGVYEELLDKKILRGFENELRLRIAECKLNLGDWNAFGKELRKLEKKVKGTYLEPEVYIYEALYHSLNGDLEKANSFLEKTEGFRDYKNSSRTLFLRGIIAYKRRNYREAIKFFEKTDYPFAMLYEARAFALLREPDQSIYVYRRLLSNPENSIDEGIIRFGIVEALFIYGDYSATQIEAEGFLKDFPSHILADYVKYMDGIAKYKEENYDNAIKILLPLTQRDYFEFKDLASYFTGSAKLKTGDIDGAIEYLQKARTGSSVELDEICFLKLAQAYLLKGDISNLEVISSQFASLFEGGKYGGIGYYIKGATNLLQEEREDAIESFLYIVDNYPSSIFRFPAAAYLIYTYLSSGKPEKAISFSNTIVEDLTSSSNIWAGWALLARAEALYRRGKISEAENIYLHIKQNFKDRLLLGHAKCGLGWCFLSEERYNEAYNALHEVANLYSDTTLLIQSHYGLGIVYFNSGDYKEAFKEFAALAKTFHGHSIEPWALLYKGLSLYALKAYGDAVKTWEYVVSNFGNTEAAEEAAYRAADTYNKAAEYDKSIALLNWLLDHFPSGKRAARAQLLLAQNYFNKKEYDTAIQEYAKFLVTFPESELKDAVKEGMAQAYYFYSRENPDALDDFIKLFPSSELAAQALYELGVKAYENKNLENAAQIFMKLALTFPKSEKAPKALLYSGQLYLTLSKWQEASSAFKKFLDFYPDGEGKDRALFGLGTAYIKLKKYKDAISALKTVVDSFPGSEYKLKAMKNMGIAYAESGDLFRASDILFQTANEYEREGNGEEAITLYQYVHDIAPDISIRMRAEEKLKKLKLGGSQ